MCKQQTSLEQLLTLIRSEGIQSISIIGMAKNVGKTVTLNYLVREAAKQNLCLALTSIGRDGEVRDEVFHTPKPRIFAPAGSLLATARGTLQHSEVQVEVLQETGFTTAMGEVIIGRACESGYVELAGPTLISHHKILLQQLLELGADLVLVDGALDRVSLAVPSLVQGIILATGAALASSADRVFQKTKERIAGLTLPAVDPCDRGYYTAIMNQCKAALVDRTGEIESLPVDGSLIAGKMLSERITSATKTIVLSGAVGDGVLQGILIGQKVTPDLHVVIRNGTCLFGDGVLWRKFIAQGGSIHVVEPIHLLAITLNPTSLRGPQFSPQEFFEIGSKVLAPYPVMDVVMEGRR